MKKFTSESQKTGEIGENIACRYLSSKGFTIIERNYTRRCGEIDIIAQKKGVIHFIEVKSIVVYKFWEKEILNTIRPEENMHAQKIRRLRSVIVSYLSEKDSEDNALWKFDVLTVVLDPEEKKAKAEMIEDVIL